MKILTMQQGSSEWLQARLGVCTASESGKLITPLGKIRTGAGVTTYVRHKATEQWRGTPDEGYLSHAMQNGKTREDAARGWYGLTAGVEIEQVGFITTDDGRWGCSPDGMFKGRTTGLECKCPELETQVNWMLDGVLPEEHIAQVQMSMLVTGAPSWTDRKSVV